LSEAHRNHPGTGCAVSALAGDIARSDKRTRAVVTRQIRDNIELAATLIRDTNEKGEGEKDKGEKDKGEKYKGEKYMGETHKRTVRSQLAYGASYRNLNWIHWHSDHSL
jgi:hypothetical protein